MYSWNRKMYPHTRSARADFAGREIRGIYIVALALGACSWGLGLAPIHGLALTVAGACHISGVGRQWPRGLGAGATLY